MKEFKEGALIAFLLITITLVVSIKNDTSATHAMTERMYQHHLQERNQ